MDGVPVYGLCQDEQENQMTSCYYLRNGEETEEVMCADGNTYTVAENEDSYDFDSSNSDCNLDEANGGQFFCTRIHFDLNFPCPRCDSSNHWPVLLLHDHRIPLGANQILRTGRRQLAMCTLSSAQNVAGAKNVTFTVDNRLCLPFYFLTECVLKVVLRCMKMSTCNAQIKGLQLSPTNLERWNPHQQWILS